MSKYQPPSNIEILWEPQAGPQTFVLQRLEKEILYGGARGGGKTDAGIAWMVEPEYIEHPEYRGLVLRETAEDLADWLDRAERKYAGLGAKKTGKPAMFKFPSGAVIRTGHLRDDDAFNKYKGHEYQKMLIEEVTQIPSEERYMKLLGSCRSTVEGLRAQMFLTTNPDGPGHFWVKKRFIEGKTPNKTYWTKEGTTRIFVPARIEDNPILMKADPDYINYLESIKQSDPDLYKQWREGDWTSFQLKGSIYAQLLDAAQAQGRITKFPIEPQIPVEGLWDLGIDDAMAIWLFQRVGNEVRFVGYYENIDEGFEHYYQELKSMASERGFILGTQYTPHDSSVRELGTGISRLDSLKKLFGQTMVEQVVPPWPRKDWVHEGINGVKRIIATSYFHADYCEAGLDRLRMYRRKWNPQLNKYYDQPLHDEFSHCADALRTGATVIVPGAIHEDKADEMSLQDLATLSNYDYYKNNPKAKQQLRRMALAKLKNI